MPRRVPLPPDLPNAFSVNDGAARGLSRSRMRGRDLEQRHHGARVAPGVTAALAYVPLLRPGDRFSHTTAAALWPLDLPRHPPKLHVTATTPRNGPRRPGVVGHRGSSDDSVLRGGVPVSDPCTLFIELATLLPEDELVAVGDALVLEPEVLDPIDLRPWVMLEELTRSCERSRSPGCRRARRALARVRPGAESRPETLLRLLLLTAGLPEPEVNGEIHDGLGRRIGRFDLVYREFRVLVEYDGHQHRTDPVQYERDIARWDRAYEAVWRVIRVRHRGLFDRPAVTVTRVREALSGTFR